MKSAFIGGSFKGAPLGGAYLDVSPSEGAAIANTAASAVRSLIRVGGAVALGVGLLYLLGGGSRGSYQATPAPPPGMPKSDQIDIESLRRMLTSDPIGKSLSSFALVESQKRTLFGVCLDEWIDVRCEGQELSIPLAFIHEIKFVKSAGGLVLIDGSRLVDVRFVKPYLCFCTITGLQTVELNHLHMRLLGGAFVEDNGKKLAPDKLNEIFKERWLSTNRDQSETASSCSRRARSMVEELKVELLTETRLIRAVRPAEADQICERLLRFLQTEESAVKHALGLERYQEYLDAALDRPRQAKPKLLVENFLQTSIYPVPRFTFREKGVLEVIMRGCEGFIRDATGKITLGLNKVDQVRPTQLLFERGELDFGQLVTIGSSDECRINLPRQEALVRGSLTRQGSYILFKMLDAHPCCIYKNGEPIIFDSQVEKTGTVVFGKDDVLEIGDAYALRWHNYYA
ncbi:MAG: hypothetical protein WC641_04935 [Patescibacteria group bacterium]